MARQRRKRHPQNRKARQRLRTPASYRHGLQDAIGKLLPGPFFSRWPVSGSKWSPLRVFWVAMLMVWSAEQTLQARFEETREVVQSLFPKWSLGKTYTGWYQAQLKWLTPLGPALCKRLRQQLQQVAGRHWLREGWCAFAADGSREECPRTKANEDELKRAGREKTGPQLFVTTLLHMGTGVPWDFRIGPGTASERRHLEEMLPDLPPQSLIIADAGFTGYEFYRRILAAKQHLNFLLRVGSNVHLLKELGYIEQQGPGTVYLWPEDNWDEPPVVLRLIERSDGDKKMYLVTNVLDKKALSEKSVGVLYEMRWGVEIFYRSLKQTLQKRRLLSRTPAAARCELTWAMYGLWLLGLMAVDPILKRGGDPLRWSAAKARDRVRRSMRRALRRHRDGSLVRDLAWATIDSYVRHRTKKARNWPHKKNETPPGAPKIQSANAKQRQAAQRLKAKQASP
jgi:hypothetical protein